MRALHYFIHLLWFAVRDLLAPPRLRLAEVGLTCGQTVLDYGCGGGSFAIAAAEIVGPQGRVYAIDEDARAVARVNRLASQRGLGNIQTIQTNTITNLTDATVDVVLLYDVYHCCEHPERVTAELHRVLRRGGTLSFFDHHVSDAAAVDQLTSRGLFEALPRIGKTRSFRCL